MPRQGHRRRPRGGSQSLGHVGPRRTPRRAHFCRKLNPIFPCYLCHRYSDSMKRAGPVRRPTGRLRPHPPEGRGRKTQGVLDRTSKGTRLILHLAITSADTCIVYWIAYNSVDRLVYGSPNSVGDSITSPDVGRPPNAGGRSGGSRLVEERSPMQRIGTEGDPGMAVRWRLKWTANRRSRMSHVNPHHQGQPVDP